MKKLTLIIFISLGLIGCVNEKQKHVERLNKLIETKFNHNDKRITLETDQDFSSSVESITILLTLPEKEKILNVNKNSFIKYYTEVDSIILTGFTYEVQNDKSRESININLKNDSIILNYTIFN